MNSQEYKEKFGVSKTRYRNMKKADLFTNEKDLLQRKEDVISKYKALVKKRKAKEHADQKRKHSDAIAGKKTAVNKTNKK